MSRAFTALFKSGPGSRRAFSTKTPRLSFNSLPKGVRESEYAVRGEIVSIAAKIQSQLDSKEKDYPFESLVACNIGNPQAVGQKAITFHRQVLSALVNHGTISDLPSDVQARATEFKNATPGAYSHSKGHPLFRKLVKEFIEKRDGALGVNDAVDAEDIFLTDGASPAVKTVIELLIDDQNDVILIPIPQYPLYSASIVRGGGTWAGYELNEDGGNWELDCMKLEQVVEEQRRAGKRVRAVAVINPGNPTGNVLSREEVEKVVRLCEKEGLVLLADEVYQENVYAPGKVFHSFRSVIHSINSDVQCFSFHSISKGFYGECGLRGGYTHLTNIDPEVNDQMYKLMSMSLCSNLIGQSMTASIMNPPKEGEPSFDLYSNESSAIKQQMAKKAELLSKKLNEIPGYKCMPIEGAMYAFPMVEMPEKFVEHCKTELKKPADAVYCIKMLEEVGVVTVPGTGFGQREGTWHFRITILPEEAELERILGGMKEFHAKFVKHWA